MTLSKQIKIFDLNVGKTKPKNRSCLSHTKSILKNEKIISKYINYRIWFLLEKAQALPGLVPVTSGEAFAAPFGQTLHQREGEMLEE